MHWPWIYHYPISAINNTIFLLANSCIIHFLFNLTLSREKNSFWPSQVSSEWRPIHTVLGNHGFLMIVKMGRGEEIVKVSCFPKGGRRWRDLARRPEPCLGSPQEERPNLLVHLAPTSPRGPSQRLRHKLSRYLLRRCWRLPGPANVSFWCLRKAWRTQAETHLICHLSITWPKYTSHSGNEREGVSPSMLSDRDDIT